jgi:GDPmannose 4,6-dehydratase
MKKKALITGINSMDGSYLAEFLLSKEYDVIGTVNLNTNNINHIKDKITIFYLDFSKQFEDKFLNILQSYNPDEIYNLAAQTSVGKSWSSAQHTMNLNCKSVLQMLEAIKKHDCYCKYFQAGSSEMFGPVPENTFITEETSFYPNSPYAVSKLHAYFLTSIYRKSYNMYNVNGILFNHESERRGINFVTRKITNGVAKIKLGLADDIILGNLDVHRDWGYAPDYVEAMWLSLQQDISDNYIIASGKTHSLKDFLRTAFYHIGIDNWEKYVKQDPRYTRPADIPILQTRPEKIKKVLGWAPKVSFEELIKKMVNNDLNLLLKMC